MRNRKLYQTAPLIVTLISSGTSPAAVISWNFDFYGTVGPSPNFSSGVAGVVPAANWTNTQPTGSNNSTIALPTNLKDNTGTGTTLDITSIVRSNVWKVIAENSHPGVDADGTYNKALLNGYLNNGGAGSASVSLAQIPYAQYDIYVYFSSDQPNRAGSVTVGSTSYYYDTFGLSSVSGSNALMVQTTETADVTNNINANYARFSNLTGASQTLSVTIPDWGGIAGFQVVQVPEPAAAMLGGLGAFCLLRRRR